MTQALNLGSGGLTAGLRDRTGTLQFVRQFVIAFQENLGKIALVVDARCLPIRHQLAR
jgi:hypothetical protein